MLARLDSLARFEVVNWNMIVDGANLTLANLRTKQGDRAGALAAVRRRVRQFYGSPFTSEFLWHEAQLAESLGDSAGALRAYRHFLALRNRPDTALSARSTHAREQLALLTRGRSK